MSLDRYRLVWEFEVEAGTDIRTDQFHIEWRETRGTRGAPYRISVGAGDGVPTLGGVRLERVGEPAPEAGSSV